MEKRERRRLQADGSERRTASRAFGEAILWAAEWARTRGREIGERVDTAVHDAATHEEW